MREYLYLVLVFVIDTHVYHQTSIIICAKRQFFCCIHSPTYLQFINSVQFDNWFPSVGDEIKS